MPSTIPREDIAARLADVGYVADRDLATALWLMDFSSARCCSRAKRASARPRSPRRWPRCTARAHPPAMLRGSRRERGALRMELPAPAPRDQGARGRAARTPTRSRSTSSPRTICSSGRCSPPSGARRRRAADRRGRPRRRGIRGLPARASLRLPGQDPRARHDQGALDPARRADLQRHARTVRRAAPPLPLSLSRFSRRRSRSGDYPHPPARHRRHSRLADRAHGRSCARRI